ncbi:MAG: hypothetical protein HY684_04560 [Chloroflexi bacterium]|nr:hypothetical protein [Chloroflexota bacterium]
MRVSVRELADLRRAQMDAEELALHARLAQITLRRLLLAVEEAHGLARRRRAEATVDLRTGEITLASQSAPRPAVQEGDT